MLKNKTIIATIDIETYPAKVLMYGSTYEPIIVKILDFEKILSMSYKIGYSKTKYIGLNTIPGYKPGDLNDKKLMIEISKVLSNIDYVCGQNSDQFDLKKIRERILCHQLPPIPDIPSLDTKKLFKQVSKLPNNKLDTLSQFVGTGQKITHSGTSLFTACGEGDPKAWKLNEKYNNQDVEITHAALMKIMPYVKLPAGGIKPIGDTMKCTHPTCSGLMHKHDLRRVVAGFKQQWKCNTCGHYHTPNKLV